MPGRARPDRGRADARGADRRWPSGSPRRAGRRPTELRDPARRPRATSWPTSARDPEAAAATDPRSANRRRDPALDPAELAAYTAVAQPDPEPGRDDHQGVSAAWTPLLEHRLRLTRRHFLGRAGRRARRWRRWRRCSARDRAAGGRDAPAACPGCRTSRPKAKRVIYLFQSGAPSQMDLFDHKPGLDGLPRHRAARLDPQGPAAHGHDLDGRTSFPVAPSRFRFARHGQSGAWRQRAAAAHRRRRRRPLLHPVDAHRGDQPRPGHHLLPDRRPARRPAEHRRLAVVRPGQREPRPARVRRPDLAGHAATRTTSRSTTGSGAAASCRRGTRASSSARSATRSSTSPTRAGSTTRPAGGCSTTSPRLNRAAATTSPATPRSPRGSPSTSWPTGCRRRSPS